MSEKTEFSIVIASIDKKPIIVSLLQQYLKELSRIPGENLSINEDGSISYPYLDCYWIENSRFPYVIQTDKLPIGFAMVSHYEDCWHMSEFYVVPAFRRKNIGTNSARLLIDTHPGIWIIEFNSYNEAGRRLWNKVASEKAVSDIKNGITEEGHLYLRFKTTR